MPKNYLEDLRQALLTLPPSGKDGFEGLVAIALAEITKTPFRLAKSGLQFGLDGKGLDGPDAISFECKRYKDSPGKDALLLKVTELCADQNPTELWIPCVTASMSTQDFAVVEAFAIKCGLPVLLLDWGNAGLPPLAVVLAIAGSAVEDFFKSAFKIDTVILASALNALKLLRQEDGFQKNADRLQSLVFQPTAGLELARKANNQWLSSAFNDPAEARQKLGQPLAPGAQGVVKTLPRKALIDPISKHFQGPLNTHILCIHGDEGCGKSWLLAKAWMILEHKPLMVLLTADDFQGVSVSIDTYEFLIPAIIKQTSDHRSEQTISRWRTRFKRWQEQTYHVPNIVVAVDGLNQKPKKDWGRILDNVNRDLGKIGGKLICTVRTQFFRSRVKQRMYSTVAEVEACPWTKEELDELLSDSALKSSSLNETVLESLSNPRIFSIAMNLLDKHDIQSFQDLNVSRLLFEHMRQSEKDALEYPNARLFAGKLQNLAEVIVKRIATGEQDDLKAFDADLEPVAECRFFQLLEDEPTRYVIREEGLALAMGFSLLAKLRKASRNGRDLGDEFQKVIEPISALDQTADVVIAALIVSCIDESYSDEIPTILIEGFANLQNPNEDDFGAFSRLVAHKPHAFMQAFRTLCLNNERSGNIDWVKFAILNGREEPRLWEQLSTDIREWFLLHSLSPDLNVIPDHTKKGGDIEEKREKEQATLTEKLQGLSSYENTLLAELTEAEGNTSNLIRNALHFIAGKPLAPFVPSFVRWSFAVSLHSDYNIPRKEFLHLARYNQIDWADARDALIYESRMLKKKDVSSVGQWALIRILNSTGTPEDGEYANTLYDELTKDRNHSYGWRLIEKYCEVDPCDPEVESSNSIATTSQKYADIDVSKLFLGRGLTREENFLQEARPGMARFEEDAAVLKHRKLIRDVSKRDKHPLLYGANALREHAVLMDRSQALAIVARLSSLPDEKIVEIKKEKAAWRTVQLLLELAFPHLTAEEQVGALLHESSGEALYTCLMSVAKPLDTNQFAKHLEKAFEDEGERKLSFLLEFAANTNTQLNSSSRRLIAELLKSKSTKVRGGAFALVENVEDGELLQQIASSGWCAEGGDILKAYENWSGSVALLKAAKAGCCSHVEVVSRLLPSFYPICTDHLDRQALKVVAEKLEQAIHKVLDIDFDNAVPEITLNAPPEKSLKAYSYMLAEREQDSKDQFAALRRQMKANEDKDFHKKIVDAFRTFSAELSLQDAHIILEHFDLGGVKNICKADPELSDRLYNLFTNVDSARIRFVANLIVFLASALSSKHPERAVLLFRLASSCDPFVKYNFTAAKVPLIPWALWHGEDLPELNQLRFKRLDAAVNNYELSLEVLAAQKHGKDRILKDYIQARLDDGKPYAVARALMVAGFCDHDPWYENVLDRFKGALGLIGEAHKAASYAYVRNVWARHWYELMCGAGTPEVFWRYSVLFLKIVDGRFELWRNSYMERKSVAETFEPTLHDRIKQRIEKWADQRKKKLFGDDAPDRVFVVPLIADEI